NGTPVDEAEIVVVTGTGLSHEPSRSATIHAAVRARSGSARVIVDIDYRPDQWAERHAFAVEMQRLLRHAHLAVGTEEELAAATDGVADVEEAAADILGCGVEALILKRGAAGSSVFMQDGSRIDVPPFPVRVLNVLGAGDAFASG